MLLVMLAGALALNILTIVRFGLDKSHAIHGRRRTPEINLLTLALIGGSPGALLARWMFRHKTRKEPFSSRLWTIVILQGGVIGGVVGFLLAG